MFEPSERLWREWGLILNANSPLLPSAGASPLPLDVGYLLTVALIPTMLLGYLLMPLFLTLDVGYGGQMVMVSKASLML